MFRKYSILVWFVILLSLIGIYFIVTYTGSKERSFKSKVLSFDTEEITAMRFNDPEKGNTVEITKVEGSWQVIENGKSYRADTIQVSRALEMLNQMHTQRIVASKSDKWAKYEVDEETGTTVELFDDGRTFAKLYMGKYGIKQNPNPDPQQQPITMVTSYVRPDGDNIVYAVPGMLRNFFQREAKHFRDAYLFKCDAPTDISRVSIDGPSGMVTLDLSSDNWLVNGMPADSAKTMRYIRTLSNLRSSEFVNDADLTGMSPEYSMMIEGSTFSPATISAYPADSITGYFVFSDRNEGSVFNGNEGRLFDRLFAGEDDFLEE
jgi:hypothetical protein